MRLQLCYTPLCRLPRSHVLERHLISGVAQLGHALELIAEPSHGFPRLAQLVVLQVDFVQRRPELSLKVPHSPAVPLRDPQRTVALEPELVAIAAVGLGRVGLWAVSLLEFRKPLHHFGELGHGLERRGRG